MLGFVALGIALLAQRKGRDQWAWFGVTWAGLLFAGFVFAIPALLLLAFTPYRCRLCRKNLTARDTKEGECADCRELPVIRQHAEAPKQQTRQFPEGQVGSSSSMQWYLRHGGDLHGPIAHTEFLKLVTAGHIGVDDLVWRAGFAEWLRAADVDGIFSPPAGPKAAEPRAMREAASPGDATLGPTESPEARSGTAQANGQKKANYFVRHWRGELPLPVTYWVNSFLIAIVFTAIFGLTTTLDITRHPAGVASMLISIWVVALIASVWQLVGVWRSAGHHASRGGSSVWAVLARFMVILGTCNAGTQFLNSGVPQINGLFEIAAGDENMSGYTVRVLRDASELEITGPIGFGLSKEVRRALDSHPTIRLVHLNSNGGRIAEARRLAKLIAERHLITYTAVHCESACVLAFAAGSPRLIGPEATIGLHQPSIPGVEVAELAAEVKQDRAYLRSRGVSETFLDAAFSTPSESMWRPSHRELIAAGLVTRKALPNEVALSGIDFDRIEHLVDQFIQEIPLYAALRDHEPEVFADVREEMIDSLLRGASVAELRERIGPDVRDAVQKRLATASDDAVVEFGTIFVEQLRVLRASDPQLCYKVAYTESPKTALDASVLFSEELNLRELTASADVILSSALRPGPAVDRVAAVQDVERVFMKLALKYGDNLALLTESIHPSEKWAELCGMNLALFEQLLELPKPRAANSLRRAFTSDLPPAVPTEAEAWRNAPVISQSPQESRLPPLPPGYVLDSPETGR